MNKEKIIKKLLSGIEDLERSGDLVVTTTIPEEIAESIYQTLRDKWCDLEDGVLPPPEIRIESSMEASAKHLERVFNLSDTEAKSTVLKLYKKMSKTNSMNNHVSVLSGEDHLSSLPNTFLLDILNISI